MPSVADLKKTIKSLERRRSYAFAMYYQAEQKNHQEFIDLYTKHKSLCEELETVQGVPSHIVNELKAQYAKDKKKIDCPICLDVIAVDNLKFSSCGHKYCSNCLDRLFEQPEPKCGICRKKLFRKSD